jgi:L-threonylcarbamoyladenylate synthase
MRLLVDSPDSFRRAADRIEAGEVVACPTDTVYGLHVDPFQEAAVARLRALKGDTGPRPFVILCDGSRAQLERLSPCRSEVVDALASRHWPGALTVVMDAGPEVPAWVTRNATVALRVPGPGAVGRLLEAWGGPLVSTSANRTGAPVLVHARDIAAEFGDDVGAILDDPAHVPSHSFPSTIVDASRGVFRVLRQGSVRVEDADPHRE